MDSVVFRWLGVGGIEIKHKQKTLLIDPFLTRPKFYNLLFGKVPPDKENIKEKISKANYILVTHSHFDHLLDAAEIVRNTGAEVYGSKNTGEILKMEKIPKTHFFQIKPGDKISLGKFIVEVLLGSHVSIPLFSPGEVNRQLKPPFKLTEYRMDNCLGFLIEISKIRFLLWSSGNINEAPKADVIFLVPEEMPNYYEGLLNRVKPKIVFPIHWEDFFRPIDKPVAPSWRFPKFNVWPPIGRQNMQLFSQMIKNIYPQGKVIVPEIFENYEI